jgi:hypothetical protein
MVLKEFSHLFSNFIIRSGACRNGIRRTLIFGSLVVLCMQPAWPQEGDIDIQGEWSMDTRVRRSPGIVFHERDLRIFVGDRTDDGSYRVLSTLTVRAVADSEGWLNRPECAGKKECVFDDGSEGIGRLVGDKFYVDWLDEAWIDDVYTVVGNRMTGHDGNAPLDFVRVE